MNQFYESQQPFTLESGEDLPGLSLAYQTYGERNKTDDNIIVVFHALTGNTNVAEWWSIIFGNDHVLDPAKYFIICINSLGSPYGSTRPYNLDFPLFTIRDICKAYFELLDTLQVSKIFLCIGASFGGNQALEFAYSFPGLIQNLVLIASCAKESPWAIAVHETQRMALQSDPTFGSYPGGEEGIKAARAIGMLTYRTQTAYINRYDETEDKVDAFTASSYIKYQGEKFAKRFDALSYYFLTKCLDSHDIGRNRGGVHTALSRMHTPTLVISINSDMLVPPILQIEMADAMPNATLFQLDSDYGHDGFLVEGKSLNKTITQFLNNRHQARTIHKFGGKSLANGSAIEQSIDIIKSRVQRENIAIVVSARGETTDRLLELYDKACRGIKYDEQLTFLLQYQHKGINRKFEHLVQELTQTLSAIATLNIDNEDLKNKLLTYGELFSASYIALRLRQEGINVRVVDARKIIKTTNENKDEYVDTNMSRQLTNVVFSQLPKDTVPIITGFISSDANNKSTNLGRNGSNYTASLIANFIRARSVISWTDVNGIYSADPKLVNGSKLIGKLSFHDAYELANLGATILHKKTILPLLESKIPMQIKNSFASQNNGTYIGDHADDDVLKAVSIIEDLCLVSIIGNRLAGHVGIDGRIFSCLAKLNISISMISQASSEGGIGFMINRVFEKQAVSALNREFDFEVRNKTISMISSNTNLCVVAITGRHNYAFENVLRAFRKNKIFIHLFSNSMKGGNISLVINKKHKKLAANIVHQFVV